ncbi:MAG: hypothetical protein J6B89_05120 [Bacilli bacterium]|nr:hypothetical protein [Bacilli bacterium]
MKKIIILLSLTCLLTTGCSIKKLDVSNIDNIIDTVLMDKSKHKNVVFDGYSYYRPRGLKFLEKEDYNAILSDSHNNTYYLYIDVVSYYHKVDNTYEEDSNAYYSRKINDKKGGYLEINKIDDRYFIEAVYNYSKVEVFSDRNSLDNTLVNVCTLLSSIKYNDSVLETIVGDNVLNYEEESFNIFTTKKSDSNYLDYVEKYDNIYDSDSKVKDEDHIDLDSDD